MRVKFIDSHSPTCIQQKGIISPIIPRGLRLSQVHFAAVTVLIRWPVSSFYASLSPLMHVTAGVSVCKRMHTMSARSTCFMQIEVLAGEEPPSLWAESDGTGSSAHQTQAEPLDCFVFFMMLLFSFNRTGNGILDIGCSVSVTSSYV